MERLIDSHEAFFTLLDAYADTTDNERKAIEKTLNFWKLEKKL